MALFPVVGGFLFFVRNLFITGFAAVTGSVVLAVCHYVGSAIAVLNLFFERNYGAHAPNSHASYCDRGDGAMALYIWQVRQSALSEQKGGFFRC